jgi:hypothetical protein
LVLAYNDDPPVDSAIWAVSSAVERSVYTREVGGSKPSPPTRRVVRQFETLKKQVESIEAYLPLFLFSILFGLSMNYHVFLLSRIKERFDQTGDNAESVAFGLRTTGGLITGAAAIMVAVFGGFAVGDLVPLQQVGFGLATAVLIDATLVRSVLVPASMKLLGDRNWYLPRWSSGCPTSLSKCCTRRPSSAHCYPAR